MSKADGTLIPAISTESGVSIASGFNSPPSISAACSASEVTTSATSPAIAASWPGAEPW